MAEKYTYLNVLQDASGTGSPKWCQPYGCWNHADRGRWRRSTGSGPDQDSHDDSWTDHKVTGKALGGLHVETDGGWHLEGDGSNQNQLEVCRVCGSELALQRDDTGRVNRGRGGQVQYCSKRCRLDVKNARASAKRVPVPAADKVPDLTTVHVAGFGELNLSPAEWNRLTPRSGGDTVHAAQPMVRFTGALRSRPRFCADQWASMSSRTSMMSPASRIARRRGRVSRSTAPTMTPGWDAVTVVYPQASM